MPDTLFPRLDPQLSRSLAGFLETIDRTFPIPGKHRSGLPRDVADLSHALTDRRGDRDDGYLGKPAALSAYLRYFLPWNLYRLSRLLPSLDIDLADGDAVTDLGSGPLTLPIALWLSRPDLRSRKLEFRCVDRTGKVLEAGSALFSALTKGADCGWKIRTIRGSMGTRIDGDRAKLVTAINVLNELFWDDRSPVGDQAEKKAALLSALAHEDGFVLVVEPGIPRSGQFVSALRDAWIKAGHGIAAPCPHRSACPFPGSRGQKWCHFAFESEDAPSALLKLSAAAGIPKERATLSFVLAAPKSWKKTADADSAAAVPARTARIVVRIISDAINLPGGLSGRYGCSDRGLVLVEGRTAAIAELSSGELRLLPLPSNQRRDQKSGALILQ